MVASVFVLVGILFSSNSSTERGQKSLRPQFVYTNFLKIFVAAVNYKLLLKIILQHLGIVFILKFYLIYASNAGENFFEKFVFEKFV